MFKKLMCLCLAISLTLGLFISAPFAHAVSDMKTSNAGLALIKHYEGFSPTPYYDNGRYSIGYGTLCPSDKVNYYRQNPMSKKEAEEELRKAVASFEEDVNAFIDRHGLTYEQHQFDALISLVYNCGSACLVNGETLIKTLTSEPDDNELIYGLSIYSIAGGKRNIALVNRRLNEAHVFLNGEYMIQPPEHFAYALFDGNGGELSTYNVQGYDAEQTAQIIPSATREGYAFLGWFTAKTGGQQVLVLDASVKSMTLYAQWGDIPVEEPTEPEQPTEPEEPTKPEIPTEPEEPTEPETPTEPEEPTEPENPTEPEEPTEPENPTEPEEPTEPEKPTEPAFDPFEVIVIQDDVDIRFGAGLVYISVYQAYTCDKLTILEEPIELDGYHWGRCDKGWVILEYTNYFGAPVPDPNVKTYATIIADALRIRADAGTNYAIKGELTNGTRVQILETKTVNGVLWGRFDKGWICCSDEYVKMETVTETPSAPSEPEKPDVPDEPEETPTPPATVTKTYGTVTCTSLCIRTGAGTNYAYISELPNGARVEILETKTVSGRVWGRISKGWICLTGYVKLETVTENVGSTTQPEEPSKPTTPQAPTTTTKTYATVIYSFLRIRAGAGTNYAMRGQLSKGDRVEILETKRVGGDLWGRIDKGWICCTDEYVKLETVTVNTGSTTNPSTPSQPQTPTTTTKTYATVIYSFLRIRAGAGTNYAMRGQLSKGDRVEILETKRVGGDLWGRIDKGWICCIDEYVKLETVTVNTGSTTNPSTPSQPQTPTTTTKTYATVVYSFLRIRAGAGTNYAMRGQLSKGDRVEILETKRVGGVLWGRIDRGWICCTDEYVKMETVTSSSSGTETPKQETGTVTASSLNVRKGAGTNYAVVCQLRKGTKVVILEKKTVNGTVWGRIDKGWICMDYVK